MWCLPRESPTQRRHFLKDVLDGASGRRLCGGRNEACVRAAPYPVTVTVSKLSLFLCCGYLIWTVVLWCHRAIHYGFIRTHNEAFFRPTVVAIYTILLYNLVCICYVSDPYVNFSLLRPKAKIIIGILNFFSSVRHLFYPEWAENEHD